MASPYARDPATSGTQETASVAGETMLENAAHAVGSADRLFDLAAAAGHEMVEGASEQVHFAHDQADRIATGLGQTLARSMRQRPMATLAGGLVAGFIIGALWRS